jgi:hypothetical protein
MSCEYVQENYGVPACIGRRISYKGKEGIIAEDRGHYIGITMDDEKPGHINNFHPKTEGLEYLGMGKVRPMTRSQKRYKDYIDSEYPESFAEYLGIHE